MAGYARNKGSAALLVLLLAVALSLAARTAAQAHGNHTAATRTFPYGDGSLSADGRYMCFTTSAKAYSDTVCYSPTYDTQGYCYGSIGSYYCSTQYSYASSSARSMSISYSGVQGRCY